MTPASAAGRIAAVALLAVPAAFVAAPASAQTYGYGQSYSSGYGSSYGGPAYQPCQTGCGYNAPRRRYNSYDGQRDVPGDYRCDAYWDNGRTDCNAAWRDQRSSSRRYSSGYGHGSSHGRGNGYGQYGYGGGYGGGGAVYQGQYGQPDVVYSGSYGGGYGGGYPGGDYPDRYGHDHSAYGQGGRDPQRINWCCAEYRTYDPATGYYTAYSGQRVFCG